MIPGYGAYSFGPESAPAERMGPCKMDAGQDIFPLPLIHSLPGRSRRCSSQRAIVKEVNATLSSLNWMAGHKQGSSVFDATHAQSTVAARVGELVSARVPDPEAPRGRQPFVRCSVGAVCTILVRPRRLRSPIGKVRCLYQTI